MTDNALAIISQEHALNSVKTLCNIILELRSDVFKEGTDYGKIPGTGEKPTLLLPGMEKLMRALNAVPRYREVCVLRDYDRPLFHYEYECTLMDAETGCAIPGGTGIGLATSMESKWRWREAKRVCPTCGKESINKSKDKPEWYCWKKIGGCGAVFPEGDPRIAGQQIGRIENADICDQVNTICKIAQKRALSSAIKGAANVSEYFTVDLDDFAPMAVGTPQNVIDADFTVVEENPQPAPQNAPKTPSTPPPSASARPGHKIDTAPKVNGNNETQTADPQTFECKAIAVRVTGPSGGGGHMYILNCGNGISFKLYEGSKLRSAGIDTDALKTKLASAPGGFVETLKDPLKITGHKDNTGVWVVDSIELTF